MMYKLILRPLFFLFDPEKIHYKTASIIKFIFRIPGVKNISDKMYRVKNKELERNLFGSLLEQPIEAVTDLGYADVQQIIGCCLAIIVKINLGHIARFIQCLGKYFNIFIN